MNNERIKQLEESANKELNELAQKHPDLKILLDDYNKLLTQKWSKDFLKGYISCINDLSLIKKYNLKY